MGASSCTRAPPPTSSWDSRASPSGDVYLFDPATGANTRVSRSTLEPDGHRRRVGGAGDQPRWALRRLREPRATNLVPGQVDTNGSETDVFLYDRAHHGQLTLVSHRVWPAGHDRQWRVTAPPASARMAATSRTSVPQRTWFPGRPVSIDNFFVFDRQTGDLTPRQPRGGFAANRALASHIPGRPSAADGAYVAYVSSSTTSSRAAARLFGVPLRSGHRHQRLRELTRCLPGRRGARRFPAPMGGSWSTRALSSRELPGEVKRNGGRDLFLFDRVSGDRVLVSSRAGVARSRPATEPRSSGASPPMADTSHSATEATDLGGRSTRGGSFIFDRVTGVNTPSWRVIGLPPQLNQPGVSSADGVADHFHELFVGSRARGPQRLGGRVRIRAPPRRRRRRRQVGTPERPARPEHLVFHRGDQHRDPARRNGGSRRSGARGPRARSVTGGLCLVPLLSRHPRGGRARGKSA